MQSDYRQMKIALRSLRWSHLFLFLAYLFAFVCVTEVNTFRSSGFKVGLATSIYSFRDVAVYAIVMVPCVTIAILFLTRPGTGDFRKVGLKVGSFFRRHM